MIFKTARYGWLPDLPDHRDQLYGAPVELAAAPPAKVDLRPQCPLVYDQGQLGSCTANAIAAAIQFDRMKQKLAQVFPPSRLFIYYNERAIEHTIDSDSGAQIRDGIKSVGKQGDCPESEWPYGHRQIQVQTAGEVLRRRAEIHRGPVSARDADFKPAQRLSRFGLSVCLRFHRL
jgi:C1A family cysteine protease